MWLALLAQLQIFFLQIFFWNKIFGMNFFFEFENFQKIFEIFWKIKNLKIFEIFEKIKKNLKKNFWSEKNFLWKKNYPSPAQMQSPAKKVLNLLYTVNSKIEPGLQ